MRLIFPVLLLVFAAAHGRFVNRMKRELAAGSGTSVHPLAIQLKNGTTVYPYAMQLKDIDIKGIRGESGVSERKSKAKKVLEKTVEKVKRLKKKLDEQKLPANKKTIKNKE